MKLVSVLLAVGCWLSAASALQPGFDAREVARQMHSTARPPSGVDWPKFDDGEFLIDTSAPGPSPGHYGPVLGFDGANFLVVWQEIRSGSGWDIYGARVTPQGAVLDPHGFCISQATGHQYGPALAFDGANFLVVWEDEGSTDRAIYGARVTPGGAVLDPQGFCVCRAASYQMYPALSFDGANFLVVWEDLRGGGGGEQSDIYGARVTPGGAVLDSQGFCVSQAANEQRGLALGFDGGNFLVVWDDKRSGMDWDIYGARVTPQGEVLDPQGTVVSRAIGSQFAPALGFDGANFLAAWVDPRGGHEWAIYGARMTPQGAVLDPEGFVISQVADEQGGPALGFDGANFLVVWQDRRSGSPDIYGVRVTPAGVVFDGGSVVRQEEYQFYPQLALGTGNQMLLVYQGWAGTVGGKTYNTDWVWGKMNPSPVSKRADSRQLTALGPQPPLSAACCSFRFLHSLFTLHYST